MVVQVGQCGNQLGGSLFDAVAREAALMPADAQRLAMSRFFSGTEGPSTPVARAILVDTEPRVVRAALQRGSDPVGPVAAIPAPVAAPSPVPAPAASHEPRESRRMDELLKRADQALGLASGEPAARERAGDRMLRAVGRAPRASRTVRKPAVPSASQGMTGRGAGAASAARRGGKGGGGPSESRGRGRGAGAPTAPRRPRGKAGGSTGSAGGNAAEGASRGPDRSGEGGPALVTHAAPGRAGASDAGRSSRLPGRGCDWRYSPRLAIVRAGGAGNNWAVGYSRLAPGILPAVVSLVRRELAAAVAGRAEADAPGGVVLLQSLAGGTGSGVGAAVAEALRAAFPSLPLVAVAVSSEGHGAGGGGVCVGHVNTALSLDTLLRCCDAVVVASNDDLAATARSALRDDAPSLGTLNRVLAARVAALLLPCTALDREGSSAAAPLLPRARMSPLAEPLAALGLWPRSAGAAGAPRRSRALTLALCPTVRPEEAAMTTSSWRSALRRARAAVRVGAASDCDPDCRTAPASPAGLDWAGLPDASLAALGRGERPEGDPGALVLERWLASGPGSPGDGRPALVAVCRGAGRAEMQSQLSPLLRLLEEPGLLGAGALAPGLLAAASPHRFQALGASCAVLYASGRTPALLRRLVRRAASLVRAGAYLHHFEAHGVSSGRVAAALAALWTDAGDAVA